MLLDFDGLMGNGVRLQPFPRSGVAATMPDLFISALRSAKRFAKVA